MDDKKQIDEAHIMLDRLGAIGSKGAASIRERISCLLRSYRNGNPIPTNEQVVYALFGHPTVEMTGTMTFKLNQSGEVTHGR